MRRETADDARPHARDVRARVTVRHRLRPVSRARTQADPQPGAPPTGRLRIKSSRDTGTASIGHTTRQLVQDGHYALAIAARGLSGRGELAITRVGVGYDGGPEACAALAWAAAIAEGCGAHLTVRGVINDRIPALGWPSLWIEPFRECWNEVMDEEVKAVRTSIEATTAGLSVPVTATVTATFRQHRSLTYRRSPICWSSARVDGARWPGCCWAAQA